MQRFEFSECSLVYFCVSLFYKPNKLDWSIDCRRRQCVAHKRRSRGPICLSAMQHAATRSTDISVFPRFLSGVSWWNESDGRDPRVLSAMQHRRDHYVRRTGRPAWLSVSAQVAETEGEFWQRSGSPLWYLQRRQWRRSNIHVEDVHQVWYWLLTVNVHT